MKYLITHSLLSSWLWAIKDNPYEDMTTERDAYQEFLTQLRREQTPQTEDMRKGIEFEDLVTDILQGKSASGHKWQVAAEKVAKILEGALLQYKAGKDINVIGFDIYLYGRLDALKAGAIYDIKFSSGYERGKYIDSTQHPVYLELVPEAKKFVYIVTNGTEVWTETYRRDETADIKKLIPEFFDFLEKNGLTETFIQHWNS